MAKGRAHDHHRLAALKKRFAIEASGHVRELRLDLSLTQVNLGGIIEVPATHVCDYERGRRLPDLHTFARIAKELDVSIDWLLGISGI